MIQTLKKQWHLFLRSPPGHRFQEVHKRRKAKQGDSSEGRKHGLVIGGIAICLLGVVALPLPGPGTLVLAGGLMMLAAESIVVARALDRADQVRARLMSKMRQICKKMGTAKCVLLAACAAALLIGAAVSLWVWLT